jgi:hypothetical protein
VSLAPVWRASDAALSQAAFDLVVRSVANKMRRMSLVDGVFTSFTSFSFPALDCANLSGVELESNTGSTAILRDEHDAGLFKGDPNAPQGPLAWPAKSRFEIADRLQVDGRGLRQAFGGPFHHRSCGSTLSRAEYVR